MKPNNVVVGGGVGVPGIHPFGVGCGVRLYVGYRDGHLVGAAVAAMMVGAAVGAVLGGCLMVG
jgi:hypothetical protein